ncbi:MAG: DUF2220 domain-containing protein [Candidatus Thiodiazotropha sp. (ex Myrtea sp. 'scaly one' KF741663)]|nr:DUF2220 domain-containing protein [Candidatus Thiodiazotropha sp. (ex Myrtea sp. 'scaly one' KF741663)]
MSTSPGSHSCDTTAHRLLKRVANRVFAAGVLPPGEEMLTASFPATKSSIPEYYALERFADREDYHARLQMFINAGAVDVEWDRGAGERGQLSRITLTNPDAAAPLLKIALPWDVAASAIRALESVTKQGLPDVTQITEGWRHGKSPGGIGADHVHQFVDSMRVIDAAQSLGARDQDVLLRRVSAQLFGDTKRIEALARPIAFLLGESEGVDKDDVFSHLGLVKHPQPTLVSGPSTCGVQSGETIIPLVQPYLGLRPDTIAGIQPGETPIRGVLTIENLASFNEAAQDPRNPADWLIIYVAGNPTPSLLAAYQRVLQSAKPISVLHWGDIDVGGFRIAARIADAACAEGYKLNLWQMNPEQVATGEGDAAGRRQIDQIEVICQAHEWRRESEGLRRHPVFQEQEVITWDPLTLAHI